MRQLWARDRLRAFVQALASSRAKTAAIRLKWLVVGLHQQFLLSQIVPHSPWNDWPNLPVVAKSASQQTRIGLVLADAEFEFISVKL
jgi:hypothetical protein